MTRAATAAGSDRLVVTSVFMIYAPQKAANNAHRNAGQPFSMTRCAQNMSWAPVAPNDNARLAVRPAGVGRDGSILAGKMTQIVSVVLFDDVLI
jgi:hypothetical protein